MDLVVDIPEDTVKQIEARVERSEFESINEYVNFVLDEIVSKDPAVEQSTIEDNNQNVAQRLKSLGYME